MPIADYFNQDYATAREAFRRAAEAARAPAQAYELAELRGPNNEILAIDVSRVGAATADSALVLISATHGVEGLAGSGCQVGYLVDRLYEALPASACALLVHALNPYGFAWLRRVNEDGVDLNRNFIDFRQPLPSSPGYEALHDYLVPADWQGEGRRSADLALDAYIKRHGQRALQAAVTGGQYSRPTGLFYGGTEPTWSARMLMTILKQHLPSSVRRMAVLDLHTGLGPVAYGEPILTANTGLDRDRALRWYGPEVKDLSAQESVSAQLVGSIAEGVTRAFPDIELTFLGLEFGTRPVLEVLTALRGDHWMHSAGAVDPVLSADIQRNMRGAFYCERPAWQAAVYGRTADFVYRTCRAFAS
jgi:Protein of unknown function (DUF2817)